ncbi:Lipopolysaccharide core heptosyltransferase RfaQ [Burkholderiales bacterium]|nr:Lipopolysaccharide core heptosyltransferase RfaQ [Burkholderiales bacterium]
MSTSTRRSRLGGRIEVVARALADRTSRRARPADPRRILIAHHLLLGDTLMLTALVAKLALRHPNAEVAMTVPRAAASLYASRPYGLRAIAWDTRDLPRDLFDQPPFDLAYVPGDNRYAWLAAAMRARWIVAFEGDRPARKSWPVDLRVPCPAEPAAWSDMVAALADGPPPAPYSPSQWPAGPAAPFDAPGGRYAVLHVGASTPLKRWSPERWRAVAALLAARGIEPVWSGGRGEDAIVRACDPEVRHRSYAGALDLAQMRALLDRAALLVSPDTGIAHLGRIAGTPSVTLYGPGSATLTGAGRFYAAMPWRAVTVDPFPCRDQRILFKREIDWVRRCGRSIAECPHPRCMDAIGVDAVEAAIGDVLARPDPREAAP